MRFARILAVCLVALPFTASAQDGDSIRVDDRVRVRLGGSPRNSNLFIGHISSIASDTLTLAVPGGKGTMIFPRAAITQVALSNGSQSRWRRVPYVLPALAAGALLAAAPVPSGPGSNGLRNRRYVMLGVHTALWASLLARPTSERWRPVNSWLDRP